MLFLEDLKSVPLMTRFSFDALGGFYPNSGTSQILTQMLLQILLSISRIMSYFANPSLCLPGSEIAVNAK